MFVLHKALNSQHLTTAFCRQEEKQMWRHLAEEDAQAGDEASITVYGILLDRLISFKYLGSNLQRAYKKWARLTRVMIREGADVRTSVHINLVIVQSVIMYGLETWVTTPRIGRVFGRLHHRVDHRMTGRQPWQVRD